jgi:hypothetical protein
MNMEKKEQNLMQLFKAMQEDVACSGHLSDTYFKSLLEIMER